MNRSNEISGGNHPQAIKHQRMNYPVSLPSQLRHLLRSLRREQGLTQAQLASRLGVVQSRVAAIERDPGAVSVGQLLQVLAVLKAQLVIRLTDPVEYGSIDPR